MRIIALEAENLKCLKAVSIRPTGNVTHVTGDNGAGKSSLLDAIFMALGGKKSLPSTPIRRGQNSAVIKLDLGEVKVTRRFASNEKTEVIVEAASGARFPSPQRMLDDLMGELTFDPLRFAMAEPKLQLETLRGLVKLDVDLDALDGANARDYELRRDWNRKVASLTEKVNTLAQGIDPAMDVDRIDVDALTEKMEEASEHNAALNRVQVTRETMRAEIARLRATAIAKRVEAQRLLDEATQLDDSATRDENVLKNAPSLGEPIDVSDLRVQINAALKSNTLRDQQERQRATHQAAVDELQSARAMSENLTAQMEGRARQKQEAIGGAKMPIPGLGFGAGEVLYNDVPFSQASAAEKIRVSFAIAMATNPKIRVALIRDGSLLDDRNMALIEQMADENDFQVFVESVGTGRCGILIQDGEVASIDGVPVRAEDEAAAAGVGA